MLLGHLRYSIKSFSVWMLANLTETYVTESILPTGCARPYLLFDQMFLGLDVLRLDRKLWGRNYVTEFIETILCSRPCMLFDQKLLGLNVGRLDRRLGRR